MLISKAITVARSIFIVGLMNVSVLAFALYFGATEDVDKFSKYVFSFSLFSVLVILLDFGLNTSILRASTTEKSELLKSVLSAKFFLCSIVFIAIILIQTFAYSLGVSIEHVASAVLSAVIYSYWLTIRVRAQIDLNFTKFDEINFTFMLLRLFYLFIFVLFDINIAFGLIFLYALPAFTYVVISEKLLIGSLKWSTSVGDIKKASHLIRYGFIVMTSALLYTLCINSTVFFYSLRSQTEIVAGVGWALAPVALITLVFSVLRPFWLSYTSKTIVTVNQMKLIVFIIFTTFVLGVAVCFSLDGYFDYFSNLLHVPVSWIKATIISFFIMSIICLVGLLSSLLHKLNKPRWDLHFNCFRLILVAFGLYLIRYSGDVGFILGVVLSIILLSEILLALVVFRTYKRLYL